MTEAAVKAVLDKLAEVYVTRDLADLRAAFAPDPDVVMHSPGTDARVELSEIQAKAEPDMRMDREDVIASGDKAVARWRPTSSL